jgi:hypothetical protein
MPSPEGLHSSFWNYDESFGCDVLLRRALTDNDVDPPPAFSEPVTLSLAPLTPPLTPAFSLSPSLGEDSSGRGNRRQHRSSGQTIAHFELEINFCGPFR